MWHFLRLILFAGIHCINSTTGYWMDGHYVNHVCMYTKTYLCICVSAILCICMNASCIFVQTLIPFAAVRHMSPDRVKTPPAQPTRHDVIHAILQWALSLFVYMLQYTTSPSQSAQAPKRRPSVCQKPKIAPSSQRVTATDGKKGMFARCCGVPKQISASYKILTHG